eukprot:CAMPEP_0174257806 /NCGR_PEP_ID=MMETSP0439-20130205/6914_1 /TAXON_ID=0 /ORGANISM="Stereomyxa ramosa, Strain Chinc5" /LENGTH=293 /DNA_ID=CAMNT_0015341067 /DNA_START=382 /DNA_END=1263 /DNA_ORIENTATION=-
MYAVHEDEAQFLYHGIFVEQEYSSKGIEINKNDTVFDVGGNIGLFTTYLYQKFKQDIQVFAFEPIPPIFKVLAKNVEGKDNLHAYQYGISNKPVKSVSFGYYPYCTLWSGAYADTSDDEIDRILKFIHLNAKGYKVSGSLILGLVLSLFPPLKKWYIKKIIQKWNTVHHYDCQLRPLSDVIDELQETNQIEKIHLLKIDVEKAELEVLEGIRQDHWPLIDQVVAEVHDIDDRVNKMIEILEEEGFITKAIRGPPPFFMVWKLFGIERGVSYEESEMCNIYAVKRHLGRDFPEE